ncbi:addiction module protein [Kamptonema cortianum]|nr:addiction module protein [Oscillatoria laete-virens]MDK3156397.1 addiction module protein [Kamptonema cortianum]
MTMTIADIESLSREEKIKLMEALWADLSRDEQSFQPPAWHEAALKETQARFEAGLEEIHDWSEAKKQLRAMF